MNPLVTFFGVSFHLLNVFFIMSRVTVGQEEKGTTEDEMVGWYHRLDGHGYGCTLEVGDG